MKPTKKYQQDVAKALRAADAGEAYHWPTIAQILAAEVRRLQGLDRSDAHTARCN